MSGPYRDTPSWQSTVLPGTHDGLVFPALTIDGGRISELTAPTDLKRVAVALVAHLEPHLAAAARSITLAGTFDPEALGFVARLATSRLDQRLARAKDMPLDAAFALLEDAGIDPDQPADTTPSNERVRIGFAVAAKRADVVVVVDSGLDNDGQRDLVRQIDGQVERGLGVIALRGAHTGTFRPWTETTRHIGLDGRGRGRHAFLDVVVEIPNGVQLHEDTQDGKTTVRLNGEAARMVAMTIAWDATRLGYTEIAPHAFNRGPRTIEMRGVGPSLVEVRMTP